MAALESNHVNYLRGEPLPLARFRRSLKGWRRMAPVQTRLPLPEPAVWAMAGLMLAQGHKEAALIVLAMFSTYCRPSEILGLRTVDVVAPVDTPDKSFREVVIILGPFERGETTKAGLFDETVVIDDEAMPFLGSLLIEQRGLRRRTAGVSAEDDDGSLHLWSLGGGGFLTVWKATTLALGLQDFVTTPYQCRHGGASRDHRRKLRSLLEIQHRGRWASSSSLRNYDKPGRLQEAVEKIKKPVLEFAATVQQNFPRWFRVGCPPDITKRVGAF